MINRRDFIKTSAKGIGVLSVATTFPIPDAVFVKKKILCVGGHPDDPESGCGGTLARLAGVGHTVKAVYLTTGEAGIPGKSHAEAAVIRRKEAEAACKILNVDPLFFGQVDGASVLDNVAVEKMRELFRTEKPDVVFAHWPLDTHKDHQIASLMTTQMLNEHVFTLYFFEVCTGMQTMGFHPTDYVDITTTQEQKRKALYCHISQDPPGIYGCGHAAMEEFRGREMGAKAGEAFVRLANQGVAGVGLNALWPY